MKAAVIGLGVEGKKALNSLLKYGWDVYASDLNVNINIDDLPISLGDADFSPSESRISIAKDNLSIDLGFNKREEIESCDAIALSPSIWGSAVSEEFKKTGKLLCDVKNKHRSIFTIGVTGTNGKTTTTSMIREILENAGLNVLTGGNGGGGFDGYYDLMLDANENDYDVLLIEVCDMTVGFCNYCFDFDIVALTNMGNDHMDVHGSMEGYRDSLKDFFKCKTVFLNDNQIYKDEFEDVAEHMVECSPSDYDLKLFGIFNKRNAGIAENICRHVGENFFKIDESIIQSTLEDFTPVKGRLEVLKLNDCNIYIGKTDNSDAFKTVLNEVDFKTLFIGTPRHDESHRFEILDEVVKSKAEVVVLFPGLEDTLDQAVYRLHGLDYSGRIELANNLDEIIGYVAEFSHEPNLFIGGNGQENIIKIRDRLEEICKNCN